MDQKKAILFLHTLQKTINAKVLAHEPFHLSLDIIREEIRIRLPYGPAYYKNARTDAQSIHGVLSFSGKTLEEAVSNMREELFSGGRMFGIHFIGSQDYRSCRPYLKKQWDFKAAVTCEQDEPIIVITGEAKEYPLHYESAV